MRAFGLTLLIINGVLYFPLSTLPPYHGHFQLFLAGVGLLCVILSELRKTRK